MDATARPIVLLHGWGGSYASTFIRNGWVEHLANLDRPLYGIDLPGHGGGGSHDPADYADLAGSVASMLPSGSVDVIGYSLGGKLALAMAARAPERFGRLIIGGVGDNLFGPEQHGEAVAQALSEGMTETTASPVRNLVEYSKISDSDPLALAAVLRRHPNPVIDEAELKRITAHVLIVNGDEDMIANPQGRLAGSIVKYQSMQLRGVNHIGLPATFAFMAAAAEFLSAG